MSASFGALAQALAGHAARRLGWRPAEFWDATPIELAGALAPPGDNRAATIDRGELQRMINEDGHNG